MKSNNEEMLQKDLKNLENIYWCTFAFNSIGDVKLLELWDENIMTKSKFIHIKTILKKHDYEFYNVEAIDNQLLMNFYKKE